MRWPLFFVLLVCLFASGCSDGGAAATDTSDTPTTSQTDPTAESTAADTSASSSIETTTTTVPPTTVPTTWQPLTDGARILLIGDSISLGYTEGTQEELPAMEIVHHDGNARSTDFALTSNRLQNWLGGQSWDVIHFNFGLHDLSFVDPQGNEVSTETPNGAEKVDLVSYEQNLQRILDILKTTDARLIWATTTPVYDTQGSRLANSELAYNQIALAVMERNGIQVNDLHQFAIDNLSNLRIETKDNIHYSKAGYEVLATAVVEILLSTPTQ